MRRLELISSEFVEPMKSRFVDSASPLGCVLAEVWNGLKPNVGYWWMIWAIPFDNTQKPLRCEEVRFLIRHQEMPRLKGSTLKYHDQGFVPVSDLGGSKKEGWKDQIQLQERPVVSVSGRIDGDTQPAMPQSVSAKREQPAAKSSLLSRLFQNTEPSTTESGIDNAYLEVVAQEKNALRIMGWVMLRDGAPESVELIGPNGDSVEALPADE